jgi:peptidoglycan/LPS O-acetylase OafA/YrhL
MFLGNVETSVGSRRFRDGAYNHFDGRADLDDYSRDSRLATDLSYPLFDWLRFALASIVALGHVGLIAWSYAGNLAVQVFFALSGWLIGGILIDGHAKGLRRFYFNRATRLWMPYFAAVAALYLVSAARDPINREWFKFLLYDVTFTHNWFSLWPNATAALQQMPLRGTGNHFWSIAVEEQFYLFAPALIYSISIGRSVYLWGAILIALLFIGQTDFASISAGVCAASSQRLWPQWHSRPTATLLVLAGTVISAFALPYFYRESAPFFSVSLVLLAARIGKRTEIGQFFGGISFPMYLNAWIGVSIVHALIGHGQSVPVAVCAYIAGAIVGAISYLLIDRNVLARRSSWYSPRLGHTAAICAYALLFCGLGFGVFVMFHAA